MIFINSRDDPLVPEDLLIPIQNFASKILIFLVAFVIREIKRNQS